jgi:ribonuclease P protein component
LKKKQGLAISLETVLRREIDEPLASGRQTFRRHERLTRKSEYQYAYTHGRKRVGDAFICYTVRHAGQGRKLGCAVSHRVGSAVVRNRIKRYIREVYRQHRDLIAPDTQVVFVARQRSAAMAYQDCERAILQLLRKGDTPGE